MSQVNYRFEIDIAIPLEEAEATLHLALIAIEGLFTSAAVRLDARYWVDEPGRALTIDSSTPVGQALARVFATLLGKEFGDARFVVRRILGSQPMGTALPTESSADPQGLDVLPCAIAL